MKPASMREPMEKISIEFITNIRNEEWSHR
jgi:hypothetical protein